MRRVQSRAAAWDAPERASEGAEKTLTLGEGVVQVGRFGLGTHARAWGFLLTEDNTQIQLLTSRHGRDYITIIILCS
jgi:hypothetical protein